MSVKLNARTASARGSACESAAVSACVNIASAASTSDATSIAVLSALASRSFATVAAVTVRPGRSPLPLESCSTALRSTACIQLTAALSSGRSDRASPVDTVVDSLLAETCLI